MKQQGWEYGAKHKNRQKKEETREQKKGVRKRRERAD
jgi:hypothetical protein